MFFDVCWPPFRSTGPCEASRTRRNGAGRLSTPDTGQLDEKLAAKRSPPPARPRCRCPLQFRQSQRVSSRSVFVEFLSFPSTCQHVVCMPRMCLFRCPFIATQCRPVVFSMNPVPVLHSYSVPFCPALSCPISSCPRPYVPYPSVPVSVPFHSNPVPVFPSCSVFFFISVSFACRDVRDKTDMSETCRAFYLQIFSSAEVLTRATFFHMFLYPLS